MSIHGRTIGVMTGSCTAGQLGRVPTLSILHSMKDTLVKAAFATHKTPMVTALWVDNLFVIAKSAHAAIGVKEQFLRQLKTEWVLHDKRGSVQIMLPAMAQEQITLSQDMELVTELPVLGHIVSNSGSIQPCWNKCRKALWTAFWRNGGSKRVRSSEQLRRYIAALQDRAVRPHLSYRCSCWPYQATVANEVDAIQAKMLSIAIPACKHADETVENYVRRRSRMAREKALSLGLWSTHWKKQFMRYNEHIQRSATHPAKALLAYRDSAWLRQTRATFAVQARDPSAQAPSLLAGRIGVRRLRKVQPRWEEAAGKISEGHEVRPFRAGHGVFNAVARFVARIGDYCSFRAFC